MSTSTPPNPLRELGKSGVKLPAIGFGCMGLSSGIYSDSSEQNGRDVLQAASELGCTFWDTADLYGLGHNENLIGSVIKAHRDKVFLCTKFGYAGGVGKPTIRCDRASVLKCCDESLKRLNVNQIDLYYCHRVDPNVPIEETMNAMKELQEQGKIKYIGISECSKESLERALKIVRIDAVQVEYSPWEIGPEKDGLLDVMKNHGISLVAYSPLGRGFLTGQIKSPNDLGKGDFRRTDPRFQGENFQKNLRIVDSIAELAADKSSKLGFTVTPAAFCLAWVLYQGPNVFVIPGTTNKERLRQNLEAGRVLEAFTEEDEQAVRKLVEEINVVGERYAPEHMALLGK